MSKTRELLVELCNVLYRQILTRDSLEVQLLCIEIAKQSILIVNELKDSDASNTSDNSQNDPNGNNIDNNNSSSKCEENTKNIHATLLENDIVPGKSHCYAILEVVLCLLARYCPDLNPSQTTRLTHNKSNSSSCSNGNYKLNDDNNMLIQSALQVIENLPRICTPQSAVKILPSILYLTTGVIQHMGMKSIHDNTILANCASVQASLHLLKSMATDEYALDEKSADEWRQNLEGALGKIIDLTKTGIDDDKKMDEVTVMLITAVFILHTPKIALRPAFQYPSINYFRQCFQSESTLVRLKCVQTIKSIYINADLKVSTPYIHALAPRIIEHLHSEEARNPKDEIELAVTTESITTIDSLISLAEPQNRKYFYQFKFLIKTS
jgi:hypothetical protein